MAASTLEQLRGLAEDGKAGTLLGGVAFGVGLLVVAYKAGRRICKWRRTRRHQRRSRVAPLGGISASAIGLDPATLSAATPPAPIPALVPQAIVAPVAPVAPSLADVGNASFHTAPGDSSSDVQPSGSE
jgi:hypothetical protein